MFNWGVKHVLTKRDSIVASVRKSQARYLKRNHKFGIELPKTVELALALDDQNDNTFCHDAVAKEMANVRASFKILPDRVQTPIRQSVHAMQYGIQHENGELAM